MTKQNDIFTSDLRAVFNWVWKVISQRWNDIWNGSYMKCGYEIKWSYDPRSYERNFCNCVKKPEKFRTSTGFEPVTSRYQLLWFCITSLSDWFKVLGLFFQPIRSETKTNRGSRVLIFPRFVSATCDYFEFCLFYWIVSVLFDWPK